MKKNKTQLDQVLAHLRTRKRITTMQAFSLYGITRLSRVVFDLRHKGYDISTTPETKNGKTYAVYRLEGNHVQKVAR